MIRWLKIVLPPPWIIALAAAAYTVFEAPIRYLEWDFGGYLDLPQRPGVFLLQISCFAYGSFRVVAFHPAFRLSYKRWLQTTPWLHPKPLPLGNVHLVAQDVVVLELLLLFGTLQINFPPLRVVNLYFLGYLSAAAGVLWLTGEWIAAYAVAFAWITSFGAWHLPAASLAVQFLAYSVACVGLWRSLARFPWALEQWENFRAGSLSSPKPLGWLYDHLSPKWTGLSL